jgi:hypothetical protein
MDIITTDPRYEKNQLLIINNQEITLINHLKELRTQKKITKKKISNLIKHNDFWYSQVERSGKNGDDNRQKTIYRTDLVDVISIIYYDARTTDALIENRSKSEVYLDKVIKARPIHSSVKPLESRDLLRKRTPDEQNRFFETQLNILNTTLQNIFNLFSPEFERDRFLDALKNVNRCLKIDPTFLLYLMELPISDFLYEAKQEQIYSLIRDIAATTDDFISNNDPQAIHEYTSSILHKVEKYVGEKKDLHLRHTTMPYDYFL